LAVDIVAFERAKYDAIWSNPGYRRKAHGLELWQQSRDLWPANVRSALDIGAGHGKLWRQWLAEGIDAHAIDISAKAPDAETRSIHLKRYHVAPLWRFDLGRAFDIGCCADVMEHLPTEMVADALACIASHCGHVVFKIANFPSNWGTGELHLTQRDAIWWHQALSEAFTIAEPRPIQSNREDYLFVCKST
jgi:2-polyprenyl-3-methyl-5-hydroxy-6-metoxy-1,4-benzoquinol methylase